MAHSIDQRAQVILGFGQCGSFHLAIIAKPAIWPCLAIRTGLDSTDGLSTQVLAPSVANEAISPRSASKIFLHFHNSCFSFFVVGKSSATT